MRVLPRNIPVWRVCLAALCLLIGGCNGSSGSSGVPVSSPAIKETLTLPVGQYFNAKCSGPAEQPPTLPACTNDQPSISNSSGTYFVAETMPESGPLTIRGIDFAWGGGVEISEPVTDGTPEYDTILDPTEPISLGDHTGYKWVAILASGFDGDFWEAPYTVTYTDGSTTTLPLWVRDWRAPASESDVPGIRVQQSTDLLDEAGSIGSIKLLMIPVDPGKALQSLTLPAEGGHTLTFAVSLTNHEVEGVVDGPRYTLKGPIETKYHTPGRWAVEKITSEAACDREGKLCDIFYPSPLGTDPQGQQPFLHPLIVWANGSGVPTERYAYFIRHLASWGFVVVASRDDMTGDGSTAVDAANFMLNAANTSDSPFFGKLDTARVGVTGHSQGGGAAMGLFARQEQPFSVYVAIHPAPSFFCYVFCNYLPGDLRNAHSGAILYLQSLGDGGAGDTRSYYDSSPDTAIKAFGVLENAKHDDVMGSPHCNSPNCITGVYGYLGYSTAWFMWHLQGASDGYSTFRKEAGEFSQFDDDWDVNISNIR